MAVEKRMILKRLLESQASSLQNETDDFCLSLSLVQTAFALLGQAEKGLSNLTEDHDILNLRAVYLGIAAMVQDMLMNSDSMEVNSMDNILTALNKSIEGYRERKTKFDLEVQTLKQDKQYEQEKLRNVEKELQTAQEALDQETDKLKNADIRYQQLLQNRQKISDDLDVTEKKCIQTEKESKELLNRFEQAQELRKDLESYEKYLRTIREGIRLEGFVNEESFNSVLDQYLSEARETIQNIDSIIGGMIKDVENLRNNIAQRQRN